MSNPRTITVVALVVIAALMRVLPHPMNFTPVAALALFAGAYLSRGMMVLMVPGVALVFSDLAMGHGFHPVNLFVYGSMLLTVGVGRLLQYRRTPLRIVFATLAGSLVFFIVTNFGFWLLTSIYPHSLEGLLQCYVRAIPFVRFTILGDFCYSVALFGGFALAAHTVPLLKEARTTKRSPNAG
ncbi:MAG: hypothetical protein MK171_06260 [Pirellulales bacterium]|nr:hypothetical protein [Pirellulales bacterium]